MSIKHSLPLLLLASACSDDPTTTRVAFTAEQDLTVFAYREVGGSWQVATRSADGAYVADVTGPYRVIAVCERANVRVITQLARTPADGDLDLGCTPRGERVVVTTAMRQEGVVSIGDASAYSTEDGSDITATVEPGTYDLIASTGERIAIRRDLAIQAPTTLPPLDLDIEGTPLRTLGYTIQNADVPRDRVFAHSWLETSTTFASLYGFGQYGVPIAPAELLRPDDRQWLEASILEAGDGISIGRSAWHTVAGDDRFVAVELPPAIEGAAWVGAGSDTRITWTALPPHDDVLLYAFGTDRNLWRLEMTAGYLAETGETGAAFETELPALRPEWRIAGKTFIEGLWVTQRAPTRSAVVSIHPEADAARYADARCATGSLLASRDGRASGWHRGCDARPMASSRP